jgi:hypothetical protein
VRYQTAPHPVAILNKKSSMNELFWSGWQDSNLRPPAPKAGAMTGLRYTPKNSVRKYNTYPLSDKYFSIISGSFFKRDLTPCN